MKKVLIISIILMLLGIGIVSNAIVTNSSEYSNVKVYVLYGEENEEYNQEKQWLDENINIRKEYINVNENNDLYAKIKEELKIKKEKFPITIIGSTYFMEYNEKIQGDIKKAIEAYEKAGDYGDIIEKIRNNEDVKDVIKQNQKIYKQPGKSNIVINIVIILLVLCIVIVIFNFFKKKKRPKKTQH